MADGPIWWPKPPGRPTGSPAPYWNLELGTWKLHSYKLGMAVLCDIKKISGPYKYASEICGNH